MRLPSNVKDMTGQRFGMLAVTSYERRPDHGAFWLCVCDCGTKTVVSGKALRKGQYSCGCVSFGKRTHNLSDSKTYQSWVDMRRRCSDSTRPSYKDYGGRGIAVCERWQNFSNFLADVGERQDGYSIERVNNDLGYSKDNCCWLPKRLQSRNRRSVRHIPLNGEMVSVADAARRLGINNTTIFYRIGAGWPVDQILESPK